MTERVMKDGYRWLIALFSTLIIIGLIMVSQRAASFF